MKRWDMEKEDREERDWDIDSKTEAEEDREQDLKRAEWGMEVKNEKEEREEKE